MNVYEKIKNMDLDEMIENKIFCHFVPIECCNFYSKFTTFGYCDESNACEMCQRNFALQDENLLSQSNTIRLNDIENS